MLGGALLLLVSRISPSVLRSWTPWLYAGSTALLVVVAVLGEGRGSMRWLDLGVMRFQPSELLKLTMPMMVAWYLHPRQLPPGWKDIAMVGMLIAIPAGLIAEQPDLGTAVLVTAAGAFALFLSGMAWWRIGALLAAVGGMIPVGWHFLHQYQRDRVLTLLNPESDPLGNGWHIIQSQIAVGSGGIFGKGWQHSTQSRLDFLPEHTTDFIFAVFSEEFGLVGVCARDRAVRLHHRPLPVDRDGGARYLFAPAGRCDRHEFLRLCLRQRRHGGRHAAGGRRADAAGQLRRHFGGFAADRVWRADVDPCQSQEAHLNAAIVVPADGPKLLRPAW